jgi:hypothetical protein
VGISGSDLFQDGKLPEDYVPPEWATWQSNDIYLPEAFYSTTSSSSLSALKQWVTQDPITSADNRLASYQQVELVVLSIGLALRALWTAQFPEKYVDAPAHVIDSPYSFSEYEELGNTVEGLIVGYREMYASSFSASVL